MKSDSQRSKEVQEKELEQARSSANEAERKRGDAERELKDVRRERESLQVGFSLNMICEAFVLTFVFLRASALTSSPRPPTPAASRRAGSTSSLTRTTG